MISSVGVFHAGRHRHQGYWTTETVSILEKAVFPTDMKTPVTSAMCNSRANATLCLFYYIMYELKGVHFVSVGVKMAIRWGWGVG